MKNPELVEILGIIDKPVEFPMGIMRVIYEDSEKGTYNISNSDSFLYDKDIENHHRDVLWFKESEIKQIEIELLNKNSGFNFLHISALFKRIAQNTNIFLPNPISKLEIKFNYENWNYSPLYMSHFHVIQNLKEKWIEYLFKEYINEIDQDRKASIYWLMNQSFPNDKRFKAAYLLHTQNNKEFRQRCEHLSRIID